MKEVEVIKARNDLQTRTRGKTIELMRVGAYCRVSTDSADQLNSYKSQVAYYTDLIKKNQEWVLADIYADEAITGTQVAKREDFQRMINDCMNGEIDMVITKSISRFARNTLDTLKYVRMLKERNIAVYFEDEKINTLTMDGELLLVVLSSVAQQEVENISANVKKGLKMKMKRGELVGAGMPIMNLVVLDDVHVVLNVREDRLPLFKMGGTFVADVPAIDKKDIEFKINYISPLGSFATWKSTKQTGSYDLRTFEIHALPVEKVEGLRPGMSVLYQLP